jgi:glycopeptide antibiotics resistance protein
VVLSSAVGDARRSRPLSVLIETLQAILPGHTTDVDDVILNTAGATLGFLAFSVVARLVRRRTAPGERTIPEPATSSAG